MNLRRITDSVRKKFNNGGAILLYHRVTRLERDPQLLAVSPDNFQQHLEVLRRTVDVVPLARFFGENRASLPPRFIAVTFDDGYADNLLEAKPLLERMEMPATIFVASGFVGSDNEFWWDELDRLMLQPEDADWNVEQESPDLERRHTYIELCKVLRSASVSERVRMLRDLRKANGSNSIGRETHRTLKIEELRALAESDLIEIGAHTVSHPMLSSISPNEQAVEIDQGKRYLENLIGTPVVSFAYPYGGKKDYNSRSVECVAKAGFSVACSNFPGMVWSTTNRFELPRFLIRNWNGDEFERRLNEIFQ